MMEDMYGLHYNTGDYSGSQLPTTIVRPVPETFTAFSPKTTTNYHHSSSHDNTPFLSYRDRIIPMTMYGSENMFTYSSSAFSDDASIVVPEIKRSFGLEDEISCAIRAKIASHPFYPKLIDAFIDCQKVGAPPEIVYILDGIRRESDVSRRSFMSSCLGVDPELDEFMELYCDILMKYKSDLARPFDEATTFLNNIETQLNNLCSDNNGTSRNSLLSEAVAGSSSEELRGAESIEMQESLWTNEEGELKDSLLRKYSGYISTLKNEFSKKKKKGKLPREARQTLLDWWSIHYKWPYPTEVEKIVLAESTGLDQKQINNWFINQRKRHWKPSENMQFAVMDSLDGPFRSNS